MLDGLLCFGLPALLMVLMYVVHTWRYVIYGISGCQAPLDMSWVTIVLLMIWPPILMCIAAYYAGKFTPISPSQEHIMLIFQLQVS